MRKAGEYDVKHRVKVMADGSQLWREVAWIPVDRVERPQHTLREMWIADCRVTFENFITYLTENDFLTDDNKLKLTGGQVKGIYYYLRDIGALPDMFMTEVHTLFGSTFELRFTDARSLQTYTFDPNEFRF